MKSYAFVSFPTLAIGVAAIAIAACDGDDTNAGGSGGTGGTGGDTTTDGGTGGTGGDGGSGGGTGGGMGGGGMGGMGGGVDCLGTPQLDGVFVIDAPELCLVAKYTAPFEVGFDDTTFASLIPTWGRHDGPTTLTQAYSMGVPQDEITIRRWEAPNGAMGSLSTFDNTGPFNVGAPNGNYFVSQAIDLPGTTWTMIAHSDFSAVGQLIALDGTTVADSWDVAGYYGAGARAATAEGRLFYTGKSVLVSAVPANDGLYAADFCTGPALCNNGTADIDNWGTASGAVAVDSRGNVLATQTGVGIAGAQVLRGYHADVVAHGDPGGVAGVDLFSMPGFGSALAAIAPTATSPGIVLFQPQTYSTQVDYGEVTIVRYLDAGAITAMGTPGTGLSGLTPTTEVTLMADAEDRIWVGVATGVGETTFFVLARNTN